MRVKKFSELNEEELQMLIELHYNYWVRFNPKMIKENTEYKFLKLYTTDNLPIGIVLVDDFENIVGFCVLKKENLKKYPDIYPWVSNLMILEKYRNNGYGKLLLSYAEEILKDLGYKRMYIWTDQVPDFYKKIGFTYKQDVEKNEGGYGELFYKDLAE